MNLNVSVRVFQPLEASIEGTRTFARRPRTTVVTRLSGTCCEFCAGEAVTEESPQPHQAPLCWPDARVSTRRAKGEVTAALVPNVEAWAAAVSLGAQGTLVMSEEVFLAASTSASAGQ